MHVIYVLYTQRMYCVHEVEIIANNGFSCCFFPFYQAKKKTRLTLA